MEAVDTNAQWLLVAWHAAKEGALQFGPSQAPLLEELLAAKLTANGLVDESSLSSEARLLGITAGGAMIYGNQQRRREEDAKRSDHLKLSDVQAELFAHFASLFKALTGVESPGVADDDEIRVRMLQRVQHETESFRTSVNGAIEALEDFYKNYATIIFSNAKKFGGMRLVLGGQRVFGPSALRGIRLTALYADTQLIPDPIYPFLTSDLHLNARHYQLAQTLFHILQLRPLVDAKLEVPPIFVFPSFEQQLDERDAHTRIGQERLAIRLLGPLCNGEVASFEDLRGYIHSQEDAFLGNLMQSGLFIPPGGDPKERLTPSEAAARYLSSQRGVRAEQVLQRMQGLPLSSLLVQGTLERLVPYYHLLDNAGELGAHPLLTQPVQWHYFETIARSNADALRARSVITEQASQTLRSIQDDSLAWLASIPVSTLATLIADNEHQWLRKELDQFTNKLTDLGDTNTSEMVRELNFGLASLVQKQQKGMRDLERRYAPKYASLLAAGAAGIGAAATAAFLPSLSPLLGLGIPNVMAATTAGGMLVGYGKTKLDARFDKQCSEQSMLGVLASVRPRQ
jgi:hypothetical protein